MLGKENVQFLNSMDFEKSEICRTSEPEVMSGRALIQEERSITSLFTTLQHSLLSLEVHNCEIALG